MSRKTSELRFDAKDWSTPPSGWLATIAQVPFNLLAGPRAHLPPSWLEGSNCQRFAYGVLSLYGLKCPPLRSSNLWEENESTRAVADPHPLDLVFFNHSQVPFGAHIGIYMARGEILHLSREIGIPAAWTFEEFAARPRYSTLVGIKTVRKF